MAIASQYYTCNKCSFRTTLLTRMNDQLKVHVGSTQSSRFSYFNCFDHLKPLKCSTCDFTTDSLVLFRYHLVLNHDQPRFALKATLKACKKCRFRTHSNYLWIRHDIFDPCKGKNGSKVKKKRQRVSLKKNKKWHQCKECDYRTTNSSNLRNHVICKHTPLKEINWQHCKKCPLKFKTVVGLKTHEKRVHGSAVDRLHCPECDYSTPARHNLAKHFNRVHTRPEEINWVECNECGAKFKDKENFKSHLKRHITGEKRFECDQCPFKTKHEADLKSHIVYRHLKDEEVQWYNCQHCEYKAKWKALINRHIKYMHSQSLELVQCPHCSFKSKYFRSIDRHIARVHNDSAFRCDLCNYKAQNEKIIQIHKKSKHGVGNVERFKCEHCDLTSKYKHNLKHHVAVKHNIDGEIFQCKECDYKTISKLYLTRHINGVHKRASVNGII